MKNLFVLLLFIFVLGCNNQGEKNESKTTQAEKIPTQDLKNEVLAIHDEVMPKMGELMSTRKTMLQVAEELMDTDSLRASKIIGLADKIDSANQGMMQWMRSYEPDFEGTEEEVRAYFETQKIAIEKVKSEMEGSLEEGLEAMKEE